MLYLLIAGSTRANQPVLNCGGPFNKFLDKMTIKAVNEKISPETISIAILNTKYLSEVIKLDRNQKAFRLSFIDFSTRSANQYRLTNGRKAIQKYRSLFDTIWKKYGIPPEVIVSFWGMETDYGLVQGNFHVLSSLGTLANDCRRSEFFQSQYLAAMKLVENQVLDAEKSLGAWAGEFGQIQMLPLDVLSFGADGDGDGRIRLADSPQDTILTAAKLITSKGWAPRQPWFEEVVLPEEFPWYETGLGRSRPIFEWMKLGVKPVDAQFFLGDRYAETTLILPQGRRGPKFFAYSNFNIFMKWNNSFVYSTTAAYFANRLMGAYRYRLNGPSDILDFDQMVGLQKILYELGYDVGNIDGILGARTRQAVRKIQMELNLPADSWPTPELLELLESL